MAIFNFVLVLAHSLYLSAQGKVDPATERTYQMLNEKFNFETGLTYKDVHPFSNNMLTFALHKGLALFFGVLEQVADPVNVTGYGRMMPIEQNQLFVMVALKGFALFLQCVLIHTPIAFIIESVYKKNSNTFKTLLVAISLTACELYTLFAVDIDYQAILYVGLLLWSQVFLLSDNVFAALFFYGLSINASLDSLLVMPFMMYRVCCKSIKSIYKDGARNGSYDLHRENFLDVSVLMQMLGKLQVDFFAFLLGMFICWVPYFVYGFDATHIAKKVNKSKASSVLFDAIDTSLYRDSVLNPHGLWN